MESWQIKALFLSFHFLVVYLFGIHERISKLLNFAKEK